MFLTRNISLTIDGLHITECLSCIVSEIFSVEERDTVTMDYY